MSTAREGIDDGAFVVRRAWWFPLLNLSLGAALLVVLVLAVMNQIEAGEPWAVPAMFTAIVAFFCVQALAQARERAPVLEIGPSGLRLPSASEQPIPWSRIWQTHAARTLLGTSAGRIDVQVDPETHTRLRLGHRFMGDVVVRRRGAPNAFSIVTQGLDANSDRIFAAMRRYWPPDQPADDI